MIVLHLHFHVKGSQKYITFEFVITSPKVSHMPGSSKWIVFVMGSRIGVVLWGVAFRTCSIQLAAFFRVIVVSIRLVSVHVVYLYSTIDTIAAGKKNAFYFIGQSASDWKPITISIIRMSGQIDKSNLDKILPEIS